MFAHSQVKAFYMPIFGQSQTWSQFVNYFFTSFPSSIYKPELHTLGIMYKVARQLATLARFPFFEVSQYFAIELKHIMKRPNTSTSPRTNILLQLNKYETDRYFLQNFQCATMLIHEFCKICDHEIVLQECKSK